MNHHLKLASFSLLILVIAFSCFGPLSAQAAVISDPSLVQPSITNTFSIAQEKTGDYLNPVNTFSDFNPTYIFVTQNPAKAGTTSINYGGSTYFVTTLVSNGNDLTSNNGIPHLADASGNILRANVTIFFDDGTYNDADSSDYYGFSATNLSLIGLNPGMVVIKRSARTDGTMERTGFQNQNIYLENLIFDGRNINMYSQSSGSRGQYFFFLAGGGSAPYNASSGFVMKNCVIQNVGSSSSLITNKNVGINIYQSSGQHNFENVTFNNVMVQSTYGIISLNDSKDNYFKNITVTNDSSHSTSSNSFSVKIEKTSTTLIPADTLANVFSETLTLPATTNRNLVYIQDFNYGKTVLPPAYRYAQYKNSNGSDYSSAIQVYQSVLPSVSSNTGILDLADNSWLVQAANAASLSNQLSYILSVKNGMNSAGALAKWPRPNIKISANNSGEIGNFTIPAFTGFEVVIVAVPGTNSLFSSNTLVPFSAGAVITGNAAVISLKLFNFDFQSKAHYTLKELTSHRGLNYVTLTDPNESGSIPGYPKYASYGYSVADLAPLFPNVNSNSFGNCNFTSLVNEIAVTPPATNSIVVGGTLSLAGGLKNSVFNSFTGSGSAGALQNSADDQTINWFSSDPSIASVNLTTGVVTAVKPGTVTIFAKAIDALNQGEIEKPYSSLSLNIVAPTATPTFTFTPTNTSTPTPTPTPNPTSTILPKATSTKFVSGNQNVGGALGIPLTGFRPNAITLLPAQPVASIYEKLGDLWLEIPAQNIQINIVGVPFDKGTWDITWLGNDAGYLAGSAYPTLNGNSVITGHNYLANGLPGPFVTIKDLKYGDEVIIHAFGQKYIYQVQQVEYLRAQDVSQAFRHTTNPSLTLLTCYQFDPTNGTYKQRVAVRAIQVRVEAQ